MTTAHTDRWDKFTTDELRYLLEVLGDIHHDHGAAALYDEVYEALTVRADEDHDAEAIEEIYG